MTQCEEARTGAAISTAGEEEEETKGSEDGEDEGDHVEDTTTWVVRSYLVLVLDDFFFNRLLLCLCAHV